MVKRNDEHVATVDGRNGFEGWRVSDGFREVRDVEVFIIKNFESGVSSMVGNGEFVCVDGLCCKWGWEEIKFD